MYQPLSGTFSPHKDVNDNLSLTHNLRDLQYRADGSGRDSHIYRNNGGMMSHQ